MKVSELIKYLESLPQDVDVHITHEGLNRRLEKEDILFVTIQAKDGAAAPYLNRVVVIDAE